MNIHDPYVPPPAEDAHEPGAGSGDPSSTSPAPGGSTSKSNGLMAGADCAADAAGEIEYASWFTSPGAGT